MKFAKTAAVLAGLLMTSASVVFAFDAKNLVSSSVYSELKSKGSLERSYFKQPNAKPALAPNTALTNAAKNLWTSSGEPVFMWEKLYLIPKTQIGNGDVSKVSIDKVSKILRSLSTLQGIQYRSSKNKMETLYKEAYCIKGPRDRTRVPDDTSGNADGKVLYCLQNDNSFGKINYRVDYRQNAQEISAVFSNTTGIFVGPIKGISEDNLKISVVTIDCGSDMMVYLLVKANFPAMGFLEKTMKESLSSRLEALYKWMIGKF
ncbi:MAG: hypothetical protein II716_02685 [Treponema sp.]|nr:hypothetical protein [Treponema sp.]MBQ4235730.1 hypothetical protein [Treponema sp.]